MDNGSNNRYYRLKNLVNIKWIMPPTPTFVECGIKYITSKNIKNSTIDFHNCKFISLDDYEKINKNWKIKTNDLLLSMIGRVGEIAIVDEKYGKFTGQNFVVIIPNKIMTKYLFYFFHKNKTKKLLIDNSIGSAQKYLSLPILQSIPIYSPPLSTQQKIIDIIEPIEKLEHTFNKLNNIISNLEAFLFNSIYKSSNHITINKLITISNVKVNSSELELRGVGYSGFVNKSNVNRSKLSKQILEDDFVIGLISKNIPIAFNWEKNKIGVSTAYYVFKPINKPMASWYIYYYLKNKNWKQFVKPTSRHGQAFEVNLFLNNTVKFVFDDYLEKRFNFIFEKIKCLKNKYDFLLNKIINVKQKLIKILII